MVANVTVGCNECQVLGMPASGNAAGLAGGLTNPEY